MTHSPLPSSGPMKIGWACADITPETPVQLHGQMHERIAGTAHDPLAATALALESSSGDHALMVSCDLVNVQQAQVERLRRRVAEELPDVDPAKLLVNATHTHTGPGMMPGLYRTPPEGVTSMVQFADRFVDRVCGAVVEAWGRRRQAGISRAFGHAAVGFNRRVVYRDGSAKMYGSSNTPDYLGPEGGEDHGVELLITWDDTDRPTGVVANIACPSQVVEGHRFISADFWHPARLEIRERLGKDLFVYPMCGAAGDQSPRDLVRRGRNEPGMRDIEGMNEMGRRIGIAVEDAFHHALGEIRREVPFQHHAEYLSLPKRKATAEEAEAARVELEKVLSNGEPEPDSAQWRFANRFREAIERFETQGDDPRYDANIHVIRIGDAAIATNPFELYLQYGQRIKARSRALQTFLAQITNDRGIYLPTRRAEEGGHYSAMIQDNIVGPDGGNMLVERQVELINRMWGQS